MCANALQDKRYRFSWMFVNLRVPDKPKRSEFISFEFSKQAKGFSVVENWLKDNKLHRKRRQCSASSCMHSFQWYYLLLDFVLTRNDRALPSL